MWERYNRIIKDNGAIVLFGNQPFTTALISSNIQGFKYSFVWDKKIPSGMNYCKYRVMQQTEDICVFSFRGNRTKYYPQLIKREKAIKGGGMKQSESAATKGFKALKRTYEYKQPTNLLSCQKIRQGSLHPTQKPVELLEYLIKTYTNEGETVLDNCMGSGSTGVACVNTRRDFIGIELDEHYFDIAKKRIQDALSGN